MTDLSVVIPLHNERDNFKELTHRLNETLTKQGLSFEVIFVDDGSRDETPKLIAEYVKHNPRARGIFFSRNFGHQAAVTAGIDHARGDAIVVMDGDLQDPPEFLTKLYAKHKEGFDVVYAIRQKRKETLWKRASYVLFYRIINRLAADVELPLDSGDFSLISRAVADTMKSMPERNRYVRGLRSWAGFRQTGLAYERDARFAGETHYSFWKLLKLAYDGIFSFSYAPITFVKIMGFLCAFISFIGILLVLYGRLFIGREVPGFAGLAIIVLFIGGIQLFSIGILGEYIRRIYDETKQRPLYVVRETIGFA